MKRIWWFFHGHKLQADKPHDDLLQMMNVDFSTRSTDGVDAYRLSRWEQQRVVACRGCGRHQRLVWISPGFGFKPINQQNSHRFHLHRELSQSSPLDVITETPHIWLPSRASELLLEEMCVSGRGRTERREAGWRAKHEDKLYIQNKVKFVFNTIAFILNLKVL